jgi:hypothetical protein
MLGYPEELAFRSTWIHRNQLETLKNARGEHLRPVLIAHQPFNKFLEQPAPAFTDACA